MGPAGGAGDPGGPPLVRRHRQDALLSSPSLKRSTAWARRGVAEPGCSHGRPWPEAPRGPRLLLGTHIGPELGPRKETPPRTALRPAPTATAPAVTVTPLPVCPHVLRPRPASEGPRLKAFIVAMRRGGGQDREAQGVGT